MREAHLGMDISEAEYRAACDDILGALEKNGLTAACSQDVAAILEQLKGEIVGR
jgi:hemoglobin